MVKQTGIARAVNDAGGVYALSERLSVSHQAVYQWLHRGHVALPRAVEIEELLGIDRRDLVKPSLVKYL